MAVNSTFTPKASLTDAPTNLKEAIDWVLRVTGKDGKGLNKETECICGLAAAVTDLLQSVQLEYNGYQGDSNGGDGKGPQKTRVTECLNGLFSLVQGLGGTSVVRTYIDQLAQVLSALVGWSKIDKCTGGGCNGGGKGNEHGKSGCGYLTDVKPNTPCKECECMKWNVTDADQEKNGHHLGRGCQRCKDSGNRDGCQCASGGCTPGKCKCAIEGKCCKCCCTNCSGTCKKECSCVKEEEIIRRNDHTVECYISAYVGSLRSWVDGGGFYKHQPIWSDLMKHPKRVITNDTPSQRRHQCARILLGSVCLIWSGITYMYWTGKYHKDSPRWNNHILDGSGLDDGTLSQWLQALGFPKTMLNDSGPKNRLDKVIWDGLRDKLYLGFPDTSTWKPDSVHGFDNEDNTFRNPAGMNYAGYIHTLEKGAFCSQGNVFNNGTTSTTDENIHKCGALYKLYILSCAYFTGLQKKNSESTTGTTANNPKTIREILYWLSALPYSQAYPEILKHGKDRLREVTKKSEEHSNETPTLAFLQEKRPHPITVHEYNLFAHFQAVTQYCPLVLIGIQGGLHSATKGTDSPAIHSLYSNSQCHFTYPTVSIQAYNQVVHYIRALFYQLYFLRKQCAVKVAMGGKWRECRYGSGVLGKDVVSWMCLGCDPMEHDRKCRVDKVKGELGKVLPQGGSGNLPGALKNLLEKIGEVVVQLGNAQERLDRGNMKLDGVRQALNKVVSLNNWKDKFIDVLKEVLGEKLCEKVKGLEKVDGLKDAKDKVTKALEAAKTAFPGNSGHIDPCKNIVSASIDGLHKALVLLKGGLEKYIKDRTSKLSYGKEKFKNVIPVSVTLEEENALLDAIKDLISICNSPKCSACDKHSDKCGQKGTPTMCKECGNMTTTGVPSPLQAFLEDRLPGFSCDVVRNTDTDKDTVYPPAASHLGHCNGSGQCCPLPMGFRGQFYSGSTSDMTGSRLYGILYFFSNENMMQSCVYTLVRVTAALSATTPQVLGDVFGFFRGGVGNKDKGKPPKGNDGTLCKHEGDPSDTSENNKDKYFCGWCASGLREEVKKIEWIYNGTEVGGKYRTSVGEALINIKDDKDSAATANTSLSTLTDSNHYVSPLTGELYTAVSATFGGTYLSWVLYLSDALQWGLESLASEFQQIECRGCKGQCDPNKCRKGSHGDNGGGQCGCQSIVSCTGVLPVLYRHGFSYGNPFNLEGYQQNDGNKNEDGQFDITKNGTGKKQCHDFLSSLNQVINKKEEATQKDQDKHPLTNLLSQVGKLQYDIRLPWIFVLTLAWLVAVLYLAFGAIWPLDWTHMRSHWLRGGEHQWEAMWYKVMTGRKGMELVEYFGKRV